MADLFSAIAEALNSYGPVIVLLAGLLILNAFFIYRDYRRESHQQRQIEALQKVHNETVLPLLTDCREAIASCKEVIYQNSQIITSWLNHGPR